MSTATNKRGTEGAAMSEHENLILVMKVKLPASSGFASCPSGDTEYEEEYRKALFSNKPTGFEVRYKRPGIEWPADSEGFTWVPLYVSDHKSAWPGLVERAADATKALRSIKEKLRELMGGTP